MIRIIATIFLAQALVAPGAWSVLLSNEKLNCSGVKIYPIEALQTEPDSSCRRVSQLAKKADNELSLSNLELINDCLCNLINKPVVWTSLIDHPLEYVMKDILSPTIKGDNADEETFLKRVDELEADGSDQLHWTVLNTFLDNYDLKIYNKGVNFKPEIPSKDPLNLLAGSCLRLTKLFEDVNQYLTDAAQLTKNSDLPYKLMKYDADFFTVFLMNKVCHTLIHNTPK